MAIVVAIDGPAASGKSTVARRAAARLGFLYVDSGALYRGVTWKALDEKLDPHDAPKVVAMTARLKVELGVVDGGVRFKLDGTDPTHAIRSREVADSVSLVAAMPEVRGRIGGWLRQTAALGDLVMEGRDIGSVVFPQTPFKFYLDASPEERARRRHAERTDGAAAASVQEVEQALKRRDTIDSGRPTAPLRVATGAVIVDSTAMPVDRVVELVVEHVRRAHEQPEPCVE